MSLDGDRGTSNYINVYYLYEPLGFSQQAQSCVPGRFVTQRNHFFQFFQTVSEMSSPETKKIRRLVNYNLKLNEYRT